MPLYTEHLNLTKPVEDEFYNIAVPNGNMDILDEHVRLLREENQALREELAGKASVGSLEKYDIEYLDGFTVAENHLSQFVKTPQDIVVVNIGVARQDGEQMELGNYTVAMIPEGFRPSLIIVSAVAISGGGHAHYITVDPNGKVRCRVTERANALHSTLVYPATQ